MIDAIVDAGGLPRLVPEQPLRILRRDVDLHRVHGTPQPCPGGPPWPEAKAAGSVLARRPRLSPATPRLRRRRAQGASNRSRHQDLPFPRARLRRPLRCFGVTSAAYTTASSRLPGGPGFVATKAETTARKEKRAYSAAMSIATTRAEAAASHNPYALNPGAIEEPPTRFIASLEAHRPRHGAGGVDCRLGRADCDDDAGGAGRGTPHCGSSSSAASSSRSSRRSSAATPLPPARPGSKR